MPLNLRLITRPVFHIDRSDNLETAEERFEYFQEHAIEESDIYGLNDEHSIQQQPATVFTILHSLSSQPRDYLIDLP